MILKDLKIIIRHCRF